ncbi:MAG: hypothetical protein ACI4XI_05985 [Ruminococcus sp.]
MEIKCVIQLEHNGDFDETLLADDLADFFEENEQTYYDKVEIKVTSRGFRVFREINNG